MSKKLELTLFGNLEIRQGGVLLTDFRSKKAQALLCFLAVTGQSQPRSILAGLLWGGFQEDKARMNLSQALTKLRQICWESLDITRQTVTIRKDPKIWVDVDVFETTLMDSSADANIPALQKAIQLYRGDFLNGFYVNKAPEFEEWVLTEQVRLREMALRTLDILVIYFTKKGFYEQAVNFARQVLAIEPWREGTHCHLMRLLALSGRRSAALKQYEICRQILLDELGVEPGAKTSTLYNRIRVGEFETNREKYEISGEPQVVSGVKQFIRGHFPDRPRFSTNLPLNSTPFIGREGELADLENLIINEGNHLVTLTGPGGIGKTRTALEFAERKLPAKTGFAGNMGEETDILFPDGVFFVSLEGLRSSDLILSAIAEAMRYQPVSGESQIIAYLRSKRLLLIIDNFENFLEGAEILSKILHTAKDVCILVTSRERLKLHMEQVYPLSGLEFPGSTLSSKEVDYSAGKLFLQTARRQRPNFDLDESELKILHRICCLVEGIPLALELAATWSNVLPLSEIVVEIERSFDFLATDFRDLPSRHRNIRAVMDVSWERLQQAEQELFSQISVFRAGFTREAAAAVNGATIRNLSNLVDKSLLRYSPSQDRYYTHELLRQFGEEKLSGNSQELENLLNCYSEYYCRWFTNQVISSVLRSVGQKTVLEAMAVELENVREAWIWGIKNLRLRPLISGVEAFGVFFRWSGGSLEGERTFENFIDCLSELDEEMNADAILLKASLLTWQAAFLFDLGKINKGSQLLKKSKGLLDSPLLSAMDTREARAHYLMNSVILSEQSREIQRERQAQAIALYREIEHPFGLPHALILGGRAAVITGRLDEADDFFRQSLELYERVGNLIGQSRSLLGLGLVSLAHNNFVEAEHLVQQAVRIIEGMEDHSRLTKVLFYLGPIYTYSGQFRQAQQISEKCTLDFDELAFPLHRGISMYYLGFAELHLGEYIRAKKYGEEALKFTILVDEIDVDTLMLPEATTCMLLGATSLVQGDYENALYMYNKAANFFEAIGSEVEIFGDGGVQIGQGTALLHLNRVDEAQSIFFSLLQRALMVHRLPTLLYGLVGFALLFALQGDTKQAVDLYSLAASHPFVGNSRWFSDLSGPFFERNAAETPSSSGVEDANTSGERPDLWAIADRLLQTNGAR